MNKRFPIPHMNAVFFSSIPIVGSPSARIHVVSFKFIAENFDLSKDNFSTQTWREAWILIPRNTRCEALFLLEGYFCQPMSCHFILDSNFSHDLQSHFLIVFQKNGSCIRKFDIQNILFCNYHDKDNFESFKCSDSELQNWVKFKSFT